MHKQISRRDFLKIVAMVGGAGAFLKLGVDRFNAPVVVKESRFLMGTVVNLTLVGGNKEHSQKAIFRVMDRMKKLETVFSRFIPESQVSRLNATGSLDDPAPALVDLLGQSRTISQLTNGAFDVTVKPLIDLYQKYLNSEGELPDEQEIKNYLPLINYERMHVAPSKIRLEHGEMGITLDGIAKGYIVDRAVDLLREFGFENVLVEAGGDLVASGANGNHLPWQIGIQSPRLETESLIAKIEVSNKAVATSGDYMQSFSPDKLQHHIIDPRKGHSSPYLASATVIAPSCLQADALATALMVMDIRQGTALIKELHNVDAYLVTKELEVISTIETKKE